MTEPTSPEAILIEYDGQIGLYQDLAGTVAGLIERMLQNSGLQLHSITQRCKSRDSLRDKLTKPAKQYTHLSEITDLAGVRITTYFAEDVDRVAAVVEREFSIDRTNTIDKRKLLDPDRFGYQSLHYVGNLTDDRCRLIEYERFAGHSFEIQVRSILQHAWAEIEHDLGYKSAAEIPRDIRRRFSQIAGLLELADDEFSMIRRRLGDYTATVSAEIRDQPQDVGIDKISLHALILSKRSAVHRLSLAVAQATGNKLEPTTDWLLESSVGMLEELNITSIGMLENAATGREGIVESFAREWLGNNVYLPFHDGIGILYLAYVLLAEKRDEGSIRKFVERTRIADDDGRDLVTVIIETFDVAVGRNVPRHSRRSELVTLNDPLASH